MPYTETFPLGANGDILQDLLRRVEVLEARARTLSGTMALQPPAATGVTSTSYTAFGSPNLLSFQVGSSGIWQLSVSVEITWNAGSTSAVSGGLLAYSVDGGAPGLIATYACQTPFGAATVAKTVQNAGWTPGTHTVALYYASLFSGAGISPVDFNGPEAVVTFV